MAYRVDPETCIGCGLCTGIAPDVFALTDAGVAEVVNQPGPQQEEQAMEALGSCPVAAISND
jgi:ferredoxin